MFSFFTRLKLTLWEARARSRSIIKVNQNNKCKTVSISKNEKYFQWSIKWAIIWFSRFLDYHFRMAITLTLKMTLSAKSFLRKIMYIWLKIKHHFHFKSLTLARDFMHLEKWPNNSVYLTPSRKSRSPSFSYQQSPRKEFFSAGLKGCVRQTEDSISLLTWTTNVFNPPTTKACHPKFYTDSLKPWKKLTKRF